MRALIVVLLTLSLGWVLVVALLAWKQEALLFHPQTLASDEPLSTAADITERRIEVPGASLSVLELRLPEPRGVVFFLHGNAGNLRSWFVNADFYRRAGFDLVMLDYRGFGKSSGQIESEAQLHADVAAVWREVAPRYLGKKVVVYGRSLGTALALRLATQIRPDLTLLVSPYSSLGALAAEHYPWVPSFVLRYPLRSDEWVAQLPGPLLLVHGANDELIPQAHSQRLLARARQGRLVTVAHAGHGDLQNFDDYLDTVRAALGAL
jgi:uncharacterized protein